MSNKNIKKRLAHPRVKTFTQKYLPVIAELYAPEQVWLFGSYTHGRPRQRSDLDLLIISQKFARRKPLRRRSRLLIETGMWRNGDMVVDPLCYTPAEFARAREQPCIIAEIVRTGIRLI